MAFPDYCTYSVGVSRIERAQVERARLVPDAKAAPCRLIGGDNVVALELLASEIRGEVTLAYLDPPFLTGRVHHRVTRSKNELTGRIERQLTPAFDDRWDELEEYLSALEERVQRVRALLAPHGAMVLHVDTKTSHYAKVLCDRIFGRDCFESEVVWRYRRWPSKTKNFQRVHDVMLRYVRDASVEPRFRQLYEPLAASTRATWGDTKQLAVVGENGRRVRSSRTSEPSRGVPLGDVWDIGIIAPVAKERTGYPTQKPEALLRRWIESCSDPGDLVLDPYAGSGTTLLVAAQLGRRAIGIDSGREALSIAKERLQAASISVLEQRVEAAPAERMPSVQKSEAKPRAVRRVAS